MTPLLEKAGGVVSRLISRGASVASAAGSLARRAVAADFWVEIQNDESGVGPPVLMTNHPDIQTPSEGHGPLTHRRYRARISGAQLSPHELIEAFRLDPNRFSPESIAVFDLPPGPAGLAVDDRVVVRLPGPWDGPVLVTRTDSGVVRLETCHGHLEAGWVQFSSSSDASGTEFVIESLARSGDPVADVLYHAAKLAKLTQTHMWVSVLENAARVSGGQLDGRPIVETTIYQSAS